MSTAIRAVGDMAVEWAPGSSGTYLYHFMNIWERRGGEWKLLVNSWTLRAAPVTPPAADTTDSGLLRTTTQEGPALH